MIIVELDLFGFAGTMVANSHLIRMKLAERHSDTLVIILPGYYYSQHPIPRFTFIIETIHRCRVGDLTAHRLPRTSRRNHAKDAMAANHRAVPVRPALLTLPAGLDSYRHLGSTAAFPLAE